MRKRERPDPSLRHVPRREWERRAFGRASGRTLRLGFAGDHELASIEALVPGSASPPHALALESATHSRTGELPSTDAVTLEAGERLELFGSEPVLPSEGTRSYFLELTGRPSEAASQVGTLRAGLVRPLRWELGANRPNPFRAATHIHFEVPERTRVEIDVFDLAGRRVSKVLDRVVEPGDHQVEWNHHGDQGRTIAPGVYFYRMRAGAFRSQRKMVLVP